MTVFDKVRRTQRILGAAALTQAFAWGLAAALAIVAAISFVSLAIPRLRGDSMEYETIAVMIGGAVAAAILWRSRYFVSTKRVALWIEECIPELHYLLVTAIEDSESPFAEVMERAVGRHNIGDATLVALRRGWIAAVAALVSALLLLYVSPSTAFGRGEASSVFGRFGGTSSVPAGSRLDDIKVLVTAPVYAGGRTVTLDDPSSIAALTGSGIAIHGKGSAAGLSASSTTPARISGVNGGWVALLMMPTKPMALTLKDRKFERTIVLDPHSDAPPRITLTSPLRDTTLRAPRLVVNLNASVTDDIGLAVGHFEYLITTGSGEIFKARTITTPGVRFGGSRNATISATLDLASLQLGEGDIVSMRAIAQDGNTFTGPGVATSDTRTIRIARAGEYDSLAIDAAAPQPIDSSATSQRMLILMTEQLVRDQPKLARADLVKRSTEIGDLEERIRRRVHEILTDNPEEIVAEKPGDSAATIEQMEAPDEITGAKNPDLVTAYNALWQAVRSLQIAEPAPALPPMRVALKALDKARVANRLYLRGMPPKIVVNLDRVRLTGKEKGSSSTRSPRGFADSARVRLSARFATVLEMIEKKPTQAMTELALMRVEALQTLPDFAAALGEASDAIRAGKDASLPLLRARRVLDGPPEVTPGLPAWTGGE
jgi:hypothetical protein